MAGKRTKTTEPAHSPTHSHSDQDSDSDAPPETLTNTASRAHAKTVEAQVKAAEAGEKARRKERNRAREEQRWGGEAVVSVSGEKVRETAKAAHKKNGKEKAKDRNKESLKVVDDEDGASDDDDEEMEMDENDDAAHELVARMNRAMEDAAAEIDDDDDESEMDDDDESEMDDDELADEDKVGDNDDEDGVENASDDDDDNDDNGDDDDGSEDDEEDSDDDELDADEGDELNAMEVDASEDSASDDDDDDDDDPDESQSHPPKSQSKHSSKSKSIPRSQYLDPDLFAAAFASTATPPAAAMSKRLDATKPTQKVRRKARSGTKAFKDVIIGTRTHRTLQHPHALPARVHPSRKVRAFLERSLKLLMRDGSKSTSTRADEGKGENEGGKKTTSRSTQNRLRAKGERWERRPARACTLTANIGTLKADGAPRGSMWPATGEGEVIGQFISSCYMNRTLRPLYMSLIASGLVPMAPGVKRFQVVNLAIHSRNHLPPPRRTLTGQAALGRQTG
ncbi:hypothetical protein BJ138DRAFT_1184195 [Hygrophoropsis aurantiaca]|uniref:Uncharacterized protein n=1 Tax=Hygrophoropsis aurantiaca TaxID=72124 RepID=A0ACB7ZSP6_9AGAM|nr:hypothetical protein BJ138DRAFT_1184195 [Hygrophoropsis aurantiaca]